MTAAAGTTVMVEAKIREIIGMHATLTVPSTSVPEEADLYSVGMSSQASVSVMVVLEGEFGLEIPDRLLRRSVFASIASIRSALSELQGGHRRRLRSLRRARR